MLSVLWKISFLLAFVVLVQSQEQKQVLLDILLDGFRWDYFDLFDDGELPGFDRLRRGGVKAESMIPSFPSYSFVNYYSSMTGLHPESNGMVHNEMWDPIHREYFETGSNPEQYEPYWWNDGEPIWITAEKQGLQSYMWYWPGCEVEIRETRPTFCDPNINLTSPGAGPTFEEFHDAVTEAVAVLTNGSADFAGVYLGTLDSSGHSHGTDSQEVLQTIRRMDIEIVYLLDIIEAEDIDNVLNLMVFGDHGMINYISDGRIDWWNDDIDMSDIDAHTGVGSVWQIWPMPDKTDEIFEKLTETLQPNMYLYKQEDVLERWHLAGHYRTPAIYAVADPGYSLLKPEVEDPGTNLTGATHGFDNIVIEMATIYLASGPTFKVDYETDTLLVVELYQLMCHVLDLIPSVHNGTWSNVEDQLRPEVLTPGSA